MEAGFLSPKTGPSGSMAVLNKSVPENELYDITQPGWADEIMKHDASATHDRQLIVYRKSYCYLT